MFDIEAAKKSGYTDPEIAGFLAQQNNFDLEGARKAGYSDQEVITNLMGGNKPNIVQPTIGERVLNAAKHVPGDIISTPNALVDLATNAFTGTGNYLGEFLPQSVHDVTNAMLPEAMRGNVPPINTAQYMRAIPDKVLGAQELPRAEDRLSSYAETGTRVAGNMLIPSGLLLKSVEGAQRAKTALWETLSALGMTIGAEEGGRLGQKYGNEELGRTVGGLAGGVYPAVAPTRLVLGSKPVQNLIQKVSNRFASADKKIDLSKTSVGEELSKFLGDSPEYAANIEAAQKTGIPGFQPDLAQSSGAPGIIGLKRRLEEQNPEFQAKAFETERANQKSITDFQNQKFPDIGVSPKQGATEAFTGQKQQLQTRLQDVNKQISSLTSKFESQPTAQIGSRLRQLRDEFKDIVRKQKDTNYNELTNLSDQIGLKTDTGDMVDFVKNTIKETGNKFQGPNMPGIFDQVLTKYGKQAKPGQVALEDLTIPESPGVTVNPSQATKEIPFRELLSLRRRANQEFYDALKGTDTDRIRYLAQFKEMVNSKIETFKSPVFGDFADKLQSADKFYNERYRVPFSEGAGGRMPYSNRFGEVTADENVGSKLLFTPGTKKGVEDFFSMYGDHPEAMSLLKKTILDEFQKQTIREVKQGGVLVGKEINPTMVDSFFRKYSETFKDPRLAGIEGELRNTENASRILQQRRAQINIERADLNRSVLKKIAGNENPEAVMDKALTTPSVMDSLIMTSKTPEHVQALSKGISDALLRKDDPFQFLIDNQKTLKPALDRLSPGHFDNLRTIANAKSILGRAPPTGIVNLQKTVTDPLEETLGTTARGVQSRALAVAKGYMSEGYVATDMAVRKLLQVGEKESRALLEQSMSDPKLAMDLATAIKNKSVTPKIKSNIMNHLYSLGVRSMGIQSNAPNQPSKDKAVFDESFFQGAP